MAAGTLNLTISNTNIDATLTDFPVVVFLDSTNASALFAELEANNLKLKVFDSTETTQRYCEIESWDDTAETAVLHVKVPSVSSSAETVLKLQYDSTFADNTTYVGVTGSTAAQNVWDSDFVAVYHMAQDPSGGAGAVKDSTSNEINATSSGSMTTGDLLDGLVNGAIDFDGSDDYLYTPDADDALNLTSTITLEAVITPSSTLDVDNPPGFIGIISRQETPDLVDSYTLGVNTDGILQFGSSGGNIQGTKNSWAADTDFYVAGTYQSSGLTGNLYVDGVAEVLTTDNYDTMAGGANSLAIGKHRSQAGDYFPGGLDEIRISKIIRAAAWIKATNYSLKDSLITIESPAAEVVCENFSLAISLFATPNIDTPQVYCEPFELSGNITASLGLAVQASDFDLSGSLTANLGLAVSSQVFSLVSNLTGSVQVVTINKSIPYYLFYLTGSADGETDIQIPIKSFQSRLRSGDPTYLSVAIQGTEYASAISARANGDLVVKMAYMDSAGDIQLAEEIARVLLESIDILEGGKNQSIVLSGHATTTPTPKTVTLEDPIYSRLYEGKYRYRFAEPDLYLRPGDTVEVDDITFTADLISYSVNARNQLMEIAEA
ncbi:MAG: hypothetical protein DRH26_06790 [Deltaproteobacteria bacterium]|nr:MAG: hypothetical protein DRH26_06790 [Deltaproteobacteria bacterium]